MRRHPASYENTEKGPRTLEEVDGKIDGPVIDEPAGLTVQDVESLDLLDPPLEEPKRKPDPLFLRCVVQCEKRSGLVQIRGFNSSVDRIHEMSLEPLDTNRGKEMPHGFNLPEPVESVQDGSVKLRVDAFGVEAYELVDTLEGQKVLELTP